MTEGIPTESGDTRPHPSAFDVEVLQANTAGDAALTTELIELCLSEAPVILIQIREAVRALDGDALRFAAHTLKGALMNFGANRAVAAAQELERLGREQSLEAVPGIHRELEEAWIELEGELQAYLQ